MWINLLVTSLCSPAILLVNKIIRLPAVISKMPLVTTVVKRDIFQKFFFQWTPWNSPTQVRKSNGIKQCKIAKWVETDQTTPSESDVDSEPLAIDKIDGRSSHPITVQLEVQGVMEFDIGAAILIISKETYDTVYSQVPSNCWSPHLHWGVKFRFVENFLSTSDTVLKLP